MSKMKFGKYKGVEIADVYDNDIGYCKWLISQKMMLCGYPDIKKFLYDKYDMSDSRFIMNWGQYKDRSIKWIFQHKRDYFNWLIKSDFVSGHCKDLHEELNKMIQCKCINRTKGKYIGNEVVHHSCNRTWCSSDKSCCETLCDIYEYTCDDCGKQSKDQ